jgi:hypothetical protein
MMDFLLKHQDLDINNGDFSLCSTDNDALAQTIAIRLKTFAGEWFLDTRCGLPYLSQVFGQPHGERAVRKLIADELKAVPGIAEVRDISIERREADRKVNVRFNAILTNKTALSINESIGA